MWSHPHNSSPPRVLASILHAKGWDFHVFPDVPSTTGNVRAAVVEPSRQTRLRCVGPGESCQRDLLSKDKSGN